MLVAKCVRTSAAVEFLAGFSMLNLKAARELAAKDAENGYAKDLSGTWEKSATPKKPSCTASDFGKHCSILFKTLFNFSLTFCLTFCMGFCLALQLNIMSPQELGGSTSSRARDDSTGRRSAKGSAPCSVSDFLRS